jgi:hypothetical protein
MQLVNHVAIRSAAATTAAGTSEVDGATIDTQGFEGVLFVAKFGTAATNNTIQAQQGEDSGLSDAADVLGSSVTVASSDELVYLDYNKPQERYVRIQAERGTSTTLDWAVAILYGPKKLPVDNTTAGTIAGESTVAPAEGTV